MKNKIYGIIPALLITGSLMAQTSKIAHRSHSGSTKSYRVNVGYNFGIPSNYEPFYKTESDQGIKNYKSKTKKKVNYEKGKHPEPKKVQKDSTVKTR